MYLKIKTNHTIDFNMPLHATPHLEDEALMVRGQTVNSGRVSGYYPRPLPPLLSFIPWPWRWENMKASSPPSSCLLITLRRILSIAIAHLSSFVSPPSCVPIQSIFISLLGSFNSCFHCRPDRSIFPCLNLRPSPFQLARWGAPSHFLHLSVTSLLLIPFNLPRFYFPLRLLLPSQYFFFSSTLCYWHIFPRLSTSFSARPHFHSVSWTCSTLPFSQKGASVDQLSSLAWCLFQPCTLWGRPDSSFGPRADRGRAPNRSRNGGQEKI